MSNNNNSLEDQIKEKEEEAEALRNHYATPVQEGKITYYKWSSKNAEAAHNALLTEIRKLILQREKK